MVGMLRAMVVVLVMAMSACVDEEAGPAGTDAEPACEIKVADLGTSITVDIWANCDDGSNLEYRLLASGLVSATRLDHPCRSLTHVEVLKAASFADLKAVGWIYNDAQRVDCTIAGDAL